MSSFQVLTTTIAAQVGTGNLVGAMTVLVTGGPGAIFWMWVAAFFGMATDFGEACLAQLYKEKDETGQTVGGPAYHISRGLGNGPAAQLLVVLCIFVGSTLKIDLVWELTDFFNGIMVIPNLVALLFLGGKVVRLLKEYKRGRSLRPGSSFEVKDRAEPAKEASR